MSGEADVRDIPEERALFVLDMKDYSQIRESQMSLVRGDLDDILAHVFAQTGLDNEWVSEESSKDTGDGAIFILPATRMWRLVDPLLGNLDQALARYDRDRLARAPVIRLRASIHVGPLTSGDYRGDAINDACRLVNSDIAYAGIAAAVEYGAYIAAVVSETSFRRTVGAARTERLSEEHFLHATARVADKPSFSESAYVHVPGVSPVSIAERLKSHIATQRDSNESRSDESTMNPSQISSPAKIQINSSNIGAVTERAEVIRQQINFPGT